MNLGVRLRLKMSFLVLVNSNFASLLASSFVPGFPVDIHHVASLLHDIDGSPDVSGNGSVTRVLPVKGEKLRFSGETSYICKT